MEKQPEVIDLAIIGGGPAALTAALYACRAGVKTSVFESNAIGGILPQIAQIENYPGFIGTGAELANIMRKQAIDAGAQLNYGECTSIRRHAQGFELEIDGVSRLARAVIGATGSKPRSLEFDLKIPVSYCALCDGSFAREKRVVVVGGANSAFQEALYLANLVKSLTIITHSAVKADAWLVERLAKFPNVEIRENLEPTADLLNQFEYAFVFIGKTPSTEMFRQLDRDSKSSKLLDPNGYILAPDNQTALAGLFAAGDVRAGALHQAVVAAADGASAALAAQAYLKTR